MLCGLLWQEILDGSWRLVFKHRVFWSWLLTQWSMPFLVSLLQLQSVKSTASSHPVSLIAANFVLLSLCFTFNKAGVGGGKKKLHLPCYFCFMLKNLCQCNSGHKVATITEWNILANLSEIDRFKSWSNNVTIMCVHFQKCSEQTNS